MRAFLGILIFYGAFSLWAQVHSFLAVDFQNDFLDCRLHGTDHYYTAGNFLTYNNIDVERRRVFSLSLIQQAFTPSNLQDTLRLNFDYPYAGLLYLSGGYRRSAHNHSWSFVATAGFGQTGKYSGVAGLQRTLHRVFKDEMPRGWDQILELGVFCQSSIGIDKLILHRKNKMLFLTQQWNWGTLYKKVQLGFRGSAGNIPLFSLHQFFKGEDQRLLSMNKGFKRISFYFAPGIEWVISNVVLEKGLLVNQISLSNAVSAPLIRNKLFKMEAGISFPVGAWSFLFRQHWQTAESYKSQPHHYGAITAVYGFSHKRRQ